jgi:proline iminopeptidase
MIKNAKWLALALVALASTACDNVLEPREPGNLVPRTVQEDLSLPAIVMNGSRFHAQTFGNPANPAIVFLHGGPGGDYRSQLRMSERFNGYSLADEYFLIYWDQRGSGLSQRHDREVLTTEVYVNDLNSLVNLLAPGKQVFLVGESWGGMFATKYINTYPERVAGAVLIEPGPLDAATMESRKDDIYDFRLTSELLNDVAWSNQFLSPDDHVRMDYQRAIGMRDAQPRSHVDRNNPEPGWRPGAAVARYLTEDGQDGRGRFNYDFTTNLAAYTTPVLFIAGSRSEVLGPSLQEEQVLRYPSASLTVINGVGHDVAWIRTAEVITHIRAYLDARKGDN